MGKWSSKIVYTTEDMYGKWGEHSMPQGQTPRWWKRGSSELSPIGHLLTNYMRDHRLVGQAELAKIIGVTQQSVSDYLKPIIIRNGEIVSRPRIPRTPILQRIAETTRAYAPPGIPLATLYHAAGITLDLDDAAPRVAVPLPLPADTHTQVSSEDTAMSDEQILEQLANRAFDEREYAAQLAKAMTLKRAIHPSSEEDWQAVCTAMMDALVAAWDFINAVSDVEKKRSKESE